MPPPSTSMITTEELPSEEHPRKRSARGPRAGQNRPRDGAVIYCTFSSNCTRPFSKRSDWKKHEEKFHEPGRQWICNHRRSEHEPCCQATFDLEVEINKHHTREHDQCSAKACYDTRQLVKRIFACGYYGCTYVTTDDGPEDENAWERRCKHVYDKHIEAGHKFEEINDWIMIKNLLGQSRIKKTWTQLSQLHFGDDTRFWPLPHWTPEQFATVKRQLELQSFIKGRREISGDDQPAITRFILGIIESLTDSPRSQLAPHSGTRHPPHSTTVQTPQQLQRQQSRHSQSSMRVSSRSQRRVPAPHTQSQPPSDDIVGNMYNSDSSPAPQHEGRTPFPGQSFPAIGNGNILPHEPNAQPPHGYLDSETPTLFLPNENQSFSISGLTPQADGTNLPDLHEDLYTLPGINPDDAFSTYFDNI
ncbi:hypothetical protein NA57DRAFT_78009 [Rhizodiscina lignyota]|uniref:C2H2-type domain-containing protein n=1 Tax=Rhizodiscina lignyota TaxID=1504668 RepID=A0A9P4M430_9PEZI|nr:hypothetical protein NA57DRAFT_78009 [Rhizodiscina lignyota]